MSWPVAKLGELCDLVNGFAFKSNDYISMSNTLCCRMSNIRPGGEFDINYNPRYLPDQFSEKYKQFLLGDGDVVIAMTDLADSPKILGVPTVIDTTGKNILLNQRVGKLVIKDKNRVYFPYLKLALNYPKVRVIYKKFAGGGLQINLGKADLLSVEIPLPSLEEQKRIAAILNKADVIRRKRQQAIDLTDQLLCSVFLDMFGDLEKKPMRWKVKLLEELVNTERGITYGIVQRGSEVPDGVPVVRIRNIRGNQFNRDGIVRTSRNISDKYSCTILTGGELLLSIRGTIGSVATVPNDIDGWNVSREIAVIPLDNISSEYVQFVMLAHSSQKFMKGNIRGVAQRGINLEHVRNLPVPIPDMELIDKFEQVVIKVNILVGKIRKKNELIDDLFSSLTQQAFCGELSKHTKAA